jgi:hypothetical protein
VDDPDQWVKMVKTDRPVEMERSDNAEVQENLEEKDPLVSQEAKESVVTPDQVDPEEREVMQVCQEYPEEMDVEVLWVHRELLEHPVHQETMETTVLTENMVALGQQV